MQITTLVSILDHPHLAADHLPGWGLRDVHRARRILLDFAKTGLTLDLLAAVCAQLAEHLPNTPDPDRALDAIGRYLLAVRSPLGLAALLGRDASAMPMLLSALSLGPRWARLLFDDPEAFDLLRQTEGQPIDHEVLGGDVLAEVAAFTDERSIVAALRRIQQRHWLRIAYGEIIGRQPVELSMSQLSLLEEVLVEAAFRAAQRKALESRSLPSQVDPRQLRCSVLALGQLGGGEADYAAPLELLVVYDVALADAATFRAVHDHFERVAKLFGRFLTEVRGDGAGYELRLMSLPDSSTSATAHAAEDVAIGLDSFGRTWHRQAMLKARAVAGDLDLGTALLKRLETWLFRRYLSGADEAGIKALKRRIVMEAILHQDDWRDVRLARGGLRDLEATLQFLQLLAGGDQPAVRTQGTLAAIVGLEAARTVSAQERAVLEESYVYLQRLEHRLQVLVGSKVAALPDDDATLARIASSLGHRGSVAELVAELKSCQERSWQTLRKLLDSAFPEEPPTPREVELLLDPAPSADEVKAALAPFGFARPEAALATLHHLAAEQVPFLSTRRCRHLLSSILPQLLCAIGVTPQPDRTLDNLARVSNSLGGKAVLWELFGVNPPLLQLYVRLCAASPYLSDILTTNPGMLDELVDSLQLDKLPTRAELQTTLDELCRGATDTLPILHDFKNAQHLRIGVRDILGKEDIDRTHEALVNVAETCLAHVAELEYRRLVERFGRPTLGPGPFEGEPCRLVIVGLGKLGGREPNYHSNLEVLFLYEDEGTTRPGSRGRREQRTANNHFFNQFAQRVLKQVSEHTPKGRLYSIDAQLRPIGIGGALALSLADFAQHFASSAAPLWQWQVLCQARPIFGEQAGCESVLRLIRQLLVKRPWRDADKDEFRRWRLQHQRGASPLNLKRGPGGTLDIEFLVQMLQLAHAAAKPQVLVTNTQDALAALSSAGVLPADLASKLGDSYRFLRRAESGLRLLNASARHDLPFEPLELGQLALLLGHGNPERLREQCLSLMADNRAAFERLLAPSS